MGRRIKIDHIFWYWLLFGWIVSYCIQIMMMVFEKFLRFYFRDNTSTVPDPEGTCRFWNTSLYSSSPEAAARFRRRWDWTGRHICRRRGVLAPVVVMVKACSVPSTRGYPTSRMTTLFTLSTMFMGPGVLPMVTSSEQKYKKHKNGEHFEFKCVCVFQAFRRFMT